MLIKGFQKLTLLDYPGQVAATIFVGGCNFNCSYCYNTDLVVNSNSMRTIPEEEIFKELEKRKKMLDGVVICGGEPTIYSNLREFIEKIKNLGFLVKLDTNGSNPEMIKKLIDEKLIDYAAMDVKETFKEYNKIANIKVDIEQIKESIMILINSEIDYEFRTTIVPGFHDVKKIKEIAGYLVNGKKYYLQLFKAEEKVRDPKLKNIKAFTKEEVDEMVKVAKEYIKTELRI